MPPYMFLRSDWKETSLSAPDNAGNDRPVRGGDRRAAGGADPAPEVPALLRVVPAEVRRRERPGRRPFASSGPTAASGSSPRRATRSSARRSWSRSAPSRSPMRSACSRTPSATAWLRHRRSHDFEAFEAAASSSSEAGRAGSRARRSPPGGRRRRADRALRPSLVRRPRAASSRAAPCASGSTGSRIRSSARAAAAQPARPPPRPVRRAAEGARAGCATHPARRRLAVASAEIESGVNVTEGVSVVSAVDEDPSGCTSATARRARGRRGHRRGRIPLLARAPRLPRRDLRKRSRSKRVPRARPLLPLERARACSSSASPPNTASARWPASFPGRVSRRTGCGRPLER